MATILSTRTHLSFLGRTGRRSREWTESRVSMTRSIAKVPNCSLRSSFQVLVQTSTCDSESRNPTAARGASHFSAACQNSESTLPRSTSKISSALLQDAFRLVFIPLHLPMPTRRPHDAGWTSALHQSVECVKCNCSKSTPNTRCYPGHWHYD